MQLGELIEFLEARDPKQEVAHGFGKPHSYRGYYEDLSFAPVAGTTVGNMLKEAKAALGNTYTGWKGGRFKMDEYTTCWLAEMGTTGEGIGPMLLKLMLGET